MVEKQKSQPLNGCGANLKRFMNTLSFHETALAVMQSNRWPFAYSLGYVSGRDDRDNQRKAEIPATATDDFALGYHKGFAEGYRPA